jgi:small subunit ribosomal protein S1
LKVGDEVKVKVISVDRDRRRIGLSIRQLQGDPWSKQVEDLKVGQLVEAEITRLTNFGAFAKLNVPGELEGLIHISEISDRRVEHPKEVLHVGDKVTLRILKIDDEQHRIGLSMRRVDSAAYADQDWKTLAADFDMGTDSPEGETLATHIGAEEPAPEEVVEEAAAVEVMAADELTTTEEPVALDDAVVTEEELAQVSEELAEPAAEAEAVAEEAVETVAEAVEEVKDTAGDLAEEAAEAVEEVKPDDEAA